MSARDSGRGTTSMEFLKGGGAMGARMRAYDWARTPLGSPGTWPQSLKTAISILATSRYAMWMAWGSELTFFCNDAYRPTLGVKDEWALGSSARKVWSEIWKDIGPRIQSVLDTGEATWDEGLLLFLERSGYPEETYHTFSYSPLTDDEGRIAGMLCVVTEETERVIGQRRLASLGDLATALSTTSTEDEVLAAIDVGLSANARDLPFTLTYLLDAAGDVAQLAGTTGFADRAPAAPTVIRLSDSERLWPLVATQTVTAIDLDERFDELPRGAWDVPPRQAVIAPLAHQGQDMPAGFLIAGVNPYRSLDATYTSFFTLTAGQIAASLANARAYDEERRRSQALAELDRAKTTFFSNVSHEFRTPLTLMLGPLQDVMEHTPADTNAHSLVATAHRNGLRLLKLVNSLLDFSRIEAGRAQAAYHPVDLATLTADIAANFHSVMERAGLAYAVELRPLPERVFVDRDMWEKIVLNLVSNAFKFTLEGEVQVSVGPSADGRSAELIVRDTGTGIPPEHVPRLFERFHRVEGAPGRTFEGTGIGLALVQELVKLHGGTISVDSTLGEGSTFVITVPFGTAHLPPERIGKTPAVATGIRAEAYVGEATRWLSDSDSSDLATFAEEDSADLGATVGHGERILLADDNADMRDYVRRLLSAQGYEVECVGDGRAALEAAVRRPPALVLSDAMMPRLDGAGLVAALRGDSRLRDVPIILLSARAGEEARVAGLETGADDYLTKPFSAKELLARVASTLKLAEARDATKDEIEERARVLQLLTEVGAAVSAELDLGRAVQKVTDAATRLTRAAFGAFFYNVIDAKGESYTLYTLSGAPREAFSKFPMPRNTAVFAPTFNGEGIVRSDDITKDPRYGHNAPHHGQPEGHLKVTSYLAAPVISRSGEVLGGLFFGHPEAAMFDASSELLIAGIAAQAAIAIDNARLYQAAQNEIARRAATEAALRESEEKLEIRVAQRTAELATANELLRHEATERTRVEEALRQVQKMESIGQLTGGVAHDFNNLLTIIMGNLETLRRQTEKDAPDFARVTRATQNAMTGAKRAAALTQQLLAFSRRQPLQPKPVDPNRLVSHMSDLLRRTIGEQIVIETVLAGGLWPVYADPNQLENAILNLAVNARDAMRGGGKLTIETANAHLDEGYATQHAEVIPGQYVVIVVTDSGSGMSRETVDRAFEPFFTTKDIGHGTGLGLSQVYGFVKQSGGHVKIYSEVGEGTSVKIYLPRLLSDVAGDDPSEDSAPELPRGAEVILAVEDDDDVRAHSTDVLRELGYRVIEARTAEIALAALSRTPEITLLFTDVGLPGGMNGRQLADEALRRRPDLKVLFTTGYARNAIVHDGRLDPGVQLITKPFTYEALATKLRDMLDSRETPNRVLVIDDERLVREATIGILEDLGFGAEEAGTASEAMSKMRVAGDRFAAAIVDLGLPDRSGAALVAEMRALRADFAVVVATGDATTDLGGITVDGNTVVLQKPYDPDELNRALDGLGVRPSAEP